MTVGAGEFLGVIGHTGSGKSTLIQHLNGLLQPTSGRILLEGRISGRIRRKYGTYASRWGWCSSTRNTSCSRRRCIRTSPLDRRTWDWTRRRSTGGCGTRRPLWDCTRRCWTSRPLSSPVDRSAVWLSRASSPWNRSVLVLDEPTAGLDPQGRDAILAQIQAYHRAKGAAVVLVSHSMEEIARNVDRIVVLSDGKVYMEGTPKQVFARAHELEQVGLDVPQVTGGRRAGRRGDWISIQRYTPWRRWSRSC